MKRKTSKKNLCSIFTVSIILMSILAFAGTCSPQGLFSLFDQGYSSDRVLVTLRSGYSRSDLSSFISRYGLSVENEMPTVNTYVLGLPSTRTVESIMDRKLQILSAYQALGSIQPDYRRYISIPQDPYYGLQWSLQPDSHIFAPEAWDYMLAGTETTVAVLDSGVRDRMLSVDITTQNPDGTESTKTETVRDMHPDLYKNLKVLPKGGLDIADGDDDPSPGDIAVPNDGEYVDWELPEIDWFWTMTGVESHGTHVAGIVSARTNNDNPSPMGISGTGNNKIKILPVKVFPDNSPYTYDSIIIDAIDYCIAGNASQKLTPPVSVINLSLGGAPPSTATRNAIRAAVRNGIVVVAATGNEAGPVIYPAAYDEAIAVGATDQDDTIASFSNTGPAVDIVAPGVDILSTSYHRFLVTPLSHQLLGDDDERIIPAPGVPFLADTNGNCYEFMSGTSMAAPHVSAAAALLVSQGVPASEVAEILYRGATPRGARVPNNIYGWGLLNISKSLKKARIDVQVLNPGDRGIVYTTRPIYRIEFRNAKRDTIRIFIDDELVIGPEKPMSEAWWTEHYKPVPDRIGMTYLEFEYSVDPYERWHNVRATADTSVPPPPPALPDTDEDASWFAVDTRFLSHGWHLFSIPQKFLTSTSPEQCFDTTRGTLFRYNYATSNLGKYSAYQWAVNPTQPLTKDPEATFMPPSVEDNSLVMPLGTPLATPPAGLGYWLYVYDNQIPIPDAAGASIKGMPYQIGLYTGWNMVGNPFSYPVSWANVVVEYAGERLTMAEAVSRGWISDNVFRWDKVLNNGYGNYTRKPMSTAIMVPWEAEWIRVRVSGPEDHPAPDIKIIVPPTPYEGIVN